MCGGSRADNFPLFWSNANQRGKVIFRRLGYRIVSFVLCCGCVVFYWAVVNGGGMRVQSVICLWAASDDPDVPDAKFRRYFL